MAALQHVNSATEITPLLACGGDYVKNGTQTLSIASVYATLDALESLWQAQTEKQHLSVRGHAQALRHYHAVYEASARCVPLSLTRWEQWLAGLSKQGAQSTVGACPDELSSSSSPQVERVQKELVDSYWHLYRRLCWGSSGAAKAGLAAVLEHTDSAASELPSVMATDTASLLAEQEAALAKPLQAFARLSAESAHLFADYPLIGRVERLWLSETVLAALGEPAEPLVEMLVRRTFKRDLQVPSVALPEVLREYEESEINEHKIKDIVAVGQATLSSSWMRAASALHAHTIHLTGTTRPNDVGGKPEASSPSGDARRKELEEQLLSVLIKVPRGQGFLPALGLLMQRLMEENAEASASTGPWCGLNGSQTQFYLYLLHQWFATYIGSHHRWSVTDMFAASDDADLWMFLLDRHAVCLTWALVTEQPALQDPAVCMHADAQLGYLNVLATSVDKLRAVFFSVVHCAQLYHASTSAFTKMEKRESRLKAATAATHSWMKEIGVETFCRALLNDLLDATAQWEEAQGDYDACVQQRALLVEAELKLILYDTMMMLQCPERSTQRLERIVEAALAMCDAWGTSERESSGCTRHEHQDLALPIIGMVGRCLHRISASLRCDVATVSAVSEAQASLYLRAVQWVKRCIVAAAAIGGDLGSLWDEWTSLVSIPVFAAEQHSSGESSHRLYPPAFLGYAVPATGRGRASRQTIVSGGLDDVCWERRTVAKAVRKELRTGIDGGGSGDERVSSCIDTAGSGEEESEHPPLKKTRAA
ncbi:conserved hypothetical protein [Leishmania mexicana MHOM/GT/2001/U1103]|uniref:Uncharacterized protein n=1 Tax=Leishmania mexicana (strain MHOM/GT/2001/U1103) TaxID=929439 RepID=E9B2T8_LEIMU|nr:conserved hypothetical protein [Leishmania mexicana MHOM/GT/2001/U1103]CBZ29552.1 conserved hypothetical protein [Leishmania mexicana MHOM/GT/2001/U1103]